MKRATLSFLAVCSISGFCGNAFADSATDVISIGEQKPLAGSSAVRIKPGEIAVPSAIASPDPATAPASGTTRNLNIIGPAPSGQVPLFLKSETIVPRGILSPEDQKKRDRRLAEEDAKKGITHRTPHLATGKTRKP